MRNIPWIKVMREAGVICLAIALIWRGAVDMFAQEIVTPTLHATPSPAPFQLSDQLHGAWLSLYHADRPKCALCYDPSFTFFLSDFKPIVKKVGDKYEITFTSEIAEGLP